MNTAIKLTIKILAAIFGTVAVVFAVGAWRLSSGPLSLSFLSPYIGEALTQNAIDYRVEFSDTVLEWAGWRQSLEIVVRDVRVLSSNGALIGKVPEISLGLSGTQLIRGKVSPTVIALLRPTLLVRRTIDGHYVFGLGPPTEVSNATGSDPAFAALLGSILQPEDRDRPLGLLREVSIRGAKFSYEDAERGLYVAAADTDLRLQRNPGGLVGELGLTAEIADLRVPLVANARYERANSMLVTTMSFGDVVPAALAERVPGLDWLATYHLPVQGVLDLRLDADGHMGPITFDLSGGAGQLAAGDVMPAPLTLSNAHASGVLSSDQSFVRFDDLYVDFSGPSANFDGVVSLTELGPGINGHVVLKNLPFDHLANYWPPVIGGGAWITANVSVGTLTEVRTDLAIKPGRLGAVQAEPGEIGTRFSFERATIHYADELPPAVGVNGVGESDGRTMTIDMADGRLGALRAPRGRAVLHDIGTDQNSITVQVELEGDAREAMRILDRPTLAYARKVGLSPDQVSGQGQAHLEVQLPLGVTIKPEQIHLTAAGTLDQFAVQHLFDRLAMTNGALTFVVDSADGMTVEGTSLIEGVPATVRWRENFGAKAEFFSRYEIKSTLDEAAAKRLGLSLEPSVRGPLPLSLVYTDFDRDRRTADLSLDGRAATIELPALYWSKPAEQEASAELHLALTKDGAVNVENFVFQARDLRAEGNFQLAGAEGGFKQAHIERLLRGSTDISADIEPNKDGAGYAIKINGDSFDLQPYLKDVMESGGERSAGNFAVELRVKHLITRADQQLTDARARLILSPDGLRTGFLEGMLSSGKSFRLQLEPDGAGRRLMARSDDAGSVARAFDLYDNAVGGKLLLQANIHDDQPGGPVDGLLKIDDYKVINAPTLANLLAFASLTGVVDILRGDGLSFARFDLPFTVKGDTLSVNNAKATGLSIGILGSGTVDLPSSQVEISGTIVPIYSVNSFLSSIPLIGEILTGGEGGGLFAATYRVVGPIEEPTITVNPLAALAPGFLRNLFSVFDGKAGDSSEPAPPPPNQGR